MYYIKRAVVSIIIIVVFIGTTYSQSITTEVFASSGTDFNSGNVSLSWTLGESFIETFKISSGIQTLGFHQIYLGASLAEAPILEENLLLRVYPNPFSKLLYINSSKESDEMHVQIYNSIGKNVFDQKIYQTNTY